MLTSRHAHTHTHTLVYSSKYVLKNETLRLGPFCFWPWHIKQKTEISTAVHIFMAILLLYKKLFLIISHISNWVRVIKLAQGLWACTSAHMLACTKNSSTNKNARYIKIIATNSYTSACDENSELRGTSVYPELRWLSASTWPTCPLHKKNTKAWYVWGTSLKLIYSFTGEHLSISSF